MATVLLLTLVFPPDAVSTAHLLGDLAEDLSNMGHQVVVLTTTPHYNQDIESREKQVLRPWLGRLVQRSQFRRIEVYHILMRPKGLNQLNRILSWVFFHIISVVLVCWRRFRCDVVLATSPPLTIGLCGAVIALLSRGRAIYNVWELYPDVAINLGVLKNAAVIRAARFLEATVYRLNAHVCPIAQGMATKIASRGVPPQKITVVPNSVDVHEFRPLPRRNPFSMEFGLDDNFVISYAGNIGTPQGLDTLLRAANHLRSRKDYLFVILGDGSEKNAILSMAKQLQLPNFRYLGYQPYSRMPEIYAACDISIVAQVGAIGNDALPSKVYRILSSGRPMLVMADPAGDLALLLRREKVGIVVSPGRDQEMADSIQWAFNHPEELRQMVDRGRQLIEGNYTRQAVSKIYSRLIRDVLR